MIIAFFQFILVALLFVFVIAFIVAVRLLRSFRSFSDIFKSFNGGMGNGNTRGRSYKDSTKDDVIIDRRSPEEMKKKIFSKNEGEYVDFEEE